MGKLMQSIDWSNTPVGPPEGWPQSLKIILRILLSSNFGMLLWWGREFIQFYNDAYRPSFGLRGEKHPKALGLRGEDCWGASWSTIYDQIRQVMDSGLATWHENQHVPTNRNGILEEGYRTYSYNPVFDESGKVVGVLLIETETTKHVIEERRSHLLRDLAVRLNQAKTIAGICSASMKILKKNPYCIPFSVLYLYDRNNNLYLAGSSNIKEYEAWTPELVEGKSNGRFPLTECISERKAIIKKNLDSEASFVPPGPWPKKPTAAYLMPLHSANVNEPIGILVAGLSSRLNFDDDYKKFLTSIKRQLVSAVVTVNTYQKYQKRAKELTESEQRFRSLADEVPMFIWMANEKIEVTYMNQTYQEYLGPEMTWDKAVHPDDIDKIYKVYYNAVKKKISFTLECRLKEFATGKYRWFFFKGVPRIEPQQGFIGVGTDIHEQKLTERALAENEELFRTIANSSPIALWMTDQQGRTNFVNKTWIDWTGIPFNEQMHTGWLESVLPEDKENLMESFHKAFENRSYWSTVYRIKRKDGKIRWFKAEGKPRHAADGEFKGYIGFATDITEKEELARQKDDFIGIASHELKTPVTSLKGYTQFLQEKFEDENDKQSAQILAKMDNQINKLTSLISDLLDVTRIEQGKIAYEKELFNFDELAMEIADNIRQINKNPRIDLKLNANCEIKGDRNRIGQVIVNLLSNAIKYASKSKNIIVTSEVKDKKIQFSVRDYGIGLSKQDKIKIFERFYRVDSKEPSYHSGLGLGLFISAEIIHRHEGEIWVESEKGEGAMFCFSLPLDNHKA